MKISDHAAFNDLKTTRIIHKYNKRFELSFDNSISPTFMALKYDDTMDQFYIRTDGDGVAESDKKPKYNNAFIFGKYHRILLPFKIENTKSNYITNKEDAEVIGETMIQNLINGLPVFIIGYGVSGSGKTTSLIYSNAEKQPGILIKLLNDIVKNANVAYTKVNVTVREFV